MYFFRLTVKYSIRKKYLNFFFFHPEKKRVVFPWLLEDLDLNPFFHALRTDHRDIWDAAALNSWLLCIPQASSLRGGTKRIDIETHVLQPSRSFPVEGEQCNEGVTISNLEAGMNYKFKVKAVTGTLKYTLVNSGKCEDVTNRYTIKSVHNEDSKFGCTTCAKNHVGKRCRKCPSAQRAIVQDSVLVVVGIYMLFSLLYLVYYEVEQKKKNDR